MKKCKNVSAAPGNSLSISLKKNGLHNEVQIFSSANPACSLRFPIAATQVKLLESKNLKSTFKHGFTYS
jgi:hypothetical protein